MINRRSRLRKQKQPKEPIKRKFSVFKSDHPEYQELFRCNITPQARKQWEKDVSSLLKSGISGVRIHKILRQNLLWEPDQMSGNFFGRFRSLGVLEGKKKGVRRHHVHERAEVAKQLIAGRLSPESAFDMMQKVWRVTEEEHKMIHKEQKVKIKDMAE